MYAAGNADCWGPDGVAPPSLSHREIATISDMEFGSVINQILRGRGCSNAINERMKPSVSSGEQSYDA